MKYAIINIAIWLCMVATAYLLGASATAIFTMAIGWTAATILTTFSTNKIWKQAFE